MKRSLFLHSLPLLLLTCSHSMYAGAMGEINKSSSPWAVEFGPRYWLSTGTYTKTLYDDDKNPLSRLKYDELTGNSAEAFWQLSHENGLFLKGYFGGGAIASGFMNDEDFLPFTDPYSNTYQEQKNGSLHYMSLDLGYRLLNNTRWQVGGFIGYHYWYERLNTFGCRQVAGNTEICGSIPPVYEPIATTTDTLNNLAVWNSLRVGVNSAVQLNKTLRLIADLAYVRSYLNANDYHNLRSNIRGIIEDGTGNGVQLEAILNWMLVPDFSIGLGGRWWHVATDGFSHFEQTANGGQPQPIDITQDSYGLLVQSNYRFDGTNNSLNADNSGYGLSWTGIYGGINLGYGSKPNTTYIYPISDAARTLQEATLSPHNINIQEAGFLAGGQVGYNWQIKQVLAGIEGDLNYAHLSGANGLSMEGFTAVTTSVVKNINWLATLRARLGTLASENTLVYLTAGPAFGGVELGFDQVQAAMSCANSFVCSSGTQSARKTGWTVGTGVEYAVSRHTTFKAEYLYVDLGSIGLNTLDRGATEHVTYNVDSKFNTNLVRLGVNYKR